MIEVLKVARDYMGKVKRVDMLVNHYLEFSFIRRNEKVVETISSGTITDMTHKRMWRTVCAIFNTYKKKSSHLKTEMDKQIPLNF